MNVIEKVGEQILIEKTEAQRWEVTGPMSHSSKCRTGPGTSASQPWPCPLLCFSPLYVRFFFICGALSEHFSLCAQVAFSLEPAVVFTLLPFSPGYVLLFNRMFSFSAGLAQLQYPETYLCHMKEKEQEAKMPSLTSTSGWSA